MNLERAHRCVAAPLEPPCTPKGDMWSTCLLSAAECVLTCAILMTSFHLKVRAWEQSLYQAYRVSSYFQRAHPHNDWLLLRCSTGMGRAFQRVRCGVQRRALCSQSGAARAEWWNDTCNGSSLPSPIAMGVLARTCAGVGFISKRVLPRPPLWDHRWASMDLQYTRYC